MSHHEIRIDLARMDDLPALVLLLRQLFTIEQDFSADSARQEKGLRLLLADSNRAAILVARDATGHAIGMVSGQLVISTAEGAPSVWIEDLVIAAPHRRRGLGLALLQRIIQWAESKGATRAQLLVDLDNQPAIDFYAHLGWQATRLGARRLTMRHQSTTHPIGHQT